ncbi:MAG: flippase [Anaerolineaceae bacterium]|nr:flippase [Anaerolineaceae bacterium]
MPEGDISISGQEARRVARNAGAIAAARIVSSGVQVIWQLVLVSALSPESFGIYGTVIAFILIGTSVTNFGMGPIVIRDVARYPHKAGKYLTATLFMQTVLALLAYLGVNAAAALGGYGEAVRVFLAIAAISLILDVLGNMCNDLLLAQERMVASSALTIAHIVVMVLLAGIGLAAGYGLFGVYAGALTASLLRAVAAWALVLRGGTRPVWPFDRGTAWPLLVNGAPLALAAFLYLAYQQIDKLLTNLILGDADTGYLSFAFFIVFALVELLNTTVLTATFPLMSRAHGDSNRELFGFIVQKLAFFTVIIVLPITLTLTIFTGDVIGWFAFLEKYRPAGEVLQILAWYALATMLVAVLSQGLTVQNRQRRTLGIRAVGLAVNITLLIVLLPTLGVPGAAVSSVCAETLALLLLLVAFRAEGWDWARLTPRLLRLALLGSGVLVLMVVLRGVHPVPGMVFGLAAYTGGILGLRILAPDDLDLLYRLTAALPGGAFIHRYWKRNVEVNF